ncbi:MAG: DUF922 domain-containing Zn-dependent protease [Leptolyngbyaceae cyanobacterium bins.302]|nr:DUF922 domain-containing Zn-dependent protease [Leptolyngbyaceae cyanobacterium bins.302]
MFNRQFAALFLFSLVFVCAISLFKPLTLQSRTNSSLEPIVNIRYRYYPIAGTTASELRSQMAAKGPRDQLEGRRYDANVDWAVNWSFRQGMSQGQCAIRSTKTRITVTYTLPQWDAPAHAERSLVAEWNQYMTALQLHEDGHKEHGVEAGRGVLQTLAHLPAASSCQELESKAQAAAQAVIKAYNQKDLEYDRTTRHGYTQGAVFPPVATVSR